MQTYVTKWGNSLGIRIPASMAEQAHIENGTPIEIQIKDDMIIIRRQTYTLEELLAQITPENLHDEVNTSDPIGNEIW
ncbi:AbrB/MazE/SpoVT family DNA-binding domain-containing protein [Effusibacillus dendaii]|uniref:Multidrug transporter MatE n=1 Tax=Effusibacillus dendaii TaxID=2743772 RepID=A0A7I8DGR7_9BACL|nr:AbrB/MazE/SpoVT family DNA-binding domain-containing protein [Effusibacillus dendaii]BCJ87770.1 multidrug transporter MatE [Effusibacillus dendaii]